MTLDELTRIVDEFAKEPCPTIGVPFGTMRQLLAVAKAAKEMLKHTERAWDGELDLEDSSVARETLTALDAALAEMEKA